MTFNSLGITHRATTPGEHAQLAGTRNRPLLVVLAVLASLVLAVTTVRPAHADGNSIVDDGITYEVLTESPATAQATDYSGGSENPSIKPMVTINGKNYAVTSIGSTAFFGDGLTGVTIPDSVTSIEDSAFLLNHLYSVTIPDKVTTIGQGAFADNRLSSVTIPNSVTHIGEAAFSTNYLTSVTIPASVTTMGSGAFRYNKITSATFLGLPKFEGNPFNGPLEYPVSPEPDENPSDLHISYLPQCGADRVGPGGFPTPTWDGYSTFPDATPRAGMDPDGPCPNASTPGTSTPVTSTPATSSAVTSTPAVTTSVTTAPATSTPATSIPVTPTPATSTPVTSTPATSIPVTSTPATSIPVTSTPAITTSVTTAPATSTLATSSAVTSTPATSTPEPAPATNTPGDSQDEKQETGVIVGAVLGVFAAFIIVPAVIIALLKQFAPAVLTQLPFRFPF